MRRQDGRDLAIEGGPGVERTDPIFAERDDYNKRMSDVAQQKPGNPELPVPYRITMAGRLGLVVFYLLHFSFTGVAISHFVHRQTTPWSGLIAAGIWLFGVAVCLYGLCDEDGGCGPIQFLINRLGTFSSRQFIQIQQRTRESPVVGFGYWFGNWRFFYFRIAMSGINEIDWDSGQTTAMVGRDMDDWLVFLRYDRGAVIGRFGRSLFPKGRDVYCLGETGPKEKTAEFGRHLVDFLREGGADLVEAEEGRRYVSRGSQSADLQRIEDRR